jgi:cytidyltransferase-like protein
VPPTILLKMTAHPTSKEIVVAVSGAFDPLHAGHIRMFKAARKLGDRLVVILNNDHWLRTKKDEVFMTEDERAELVRELACVDDVIITEHVEADADGSVSREITYIKPDIFADGGDGSNLPEREVCERIGVTVILNVGEPRPYPSSRRLQNASRRE